MRRSIAIRNVISSFTKLSDPEEEDEASPTCIVSLIRPTGMSTSPTRAVEICRKVRYLKINFFHFIKSS